MCMLTEFDRDKDEKLDKRRKFYIPHMKVMWQRNQKICDNMESVPIFLQAKGEVIYLIAIFHLEEC